LRAEGEAIQDSDARKFFSCHLNPVTWYRRRPSVRLQGAEAIVLTVPFIGKTSGSLFQAISNHDLNRIFLHHLATLGLILLLPVWRYPQHLRLVVYALLSLVAAWR